MTSSVPEKTNFFATALQIVALVLLFSGFAVGVKSFVGELSDVPHLEQPQRLS